MRFIGGLCPNAGQGVKFNAGAATVGIRGGIAKIAVESDGKLLAELVHGRLSVETPEGLFETDRIGMQIERDVSGAASTRSVTIEEVKSELDEEAKENEAVAEENIAEVPAAPAAADDNDAAEQTETPSDTPAEVNEMTALRTAPQPRAHPPNKMIHCQRPEKPKKKPAMCWSMRRLMPVLWKWMRMAILKASQALVEIDPQAAELIDEGALVVSDEGAIGMTEQGLCH